MFTRIKQVFKINSGVILTLVFFVACLGISEVTITRFNQQQNDKSWQAADIKGKEIKALLDLKLSELYKINILETYIVTLNGKVQPTEIEAFLISLYKGSHYLRNIGIAPNNQLTYLYPLAGNEKALGLNYKDNLAQWPAVERVMQEHTAYLAGPLELVEGTSGIIYLVPVFLNDGTYWGVITTVLNSTEFLSVIQSEINKTELQVAIRNKDGKETDSKTNVFYGHASFFNGDGVHVNIPVPSGNWEMVVKPVGGVTTLAKSFRIITVVLSLILSLIIYQFLFSKRQDKRNKLVEGYLKSSKISLQTVLNSIPAEMAILNREGFVLACNEAWLQYGIATPQLTGYPKLGAVIQTNLAETCGEANTNFNNPDSSDLNCENCGVCATLEGKLAAFSKEYQAGSDPKQWHHVVITPIGGHSKNGIIVMHTDITKRKLIDEDLRANKELLNSIIDSTPSNIFAFDLQNRFILLNKTQEDFYGKCKDEVLGKTVHDFFPDDIANKLEADNNYVLTTGNSLLVEELLVRQLDNTKHTMLTSKFPIRNNMGEIIGLAGVATNITSRKQSDKQLRLSDTALNTINQGVVITDAEQNIQWTNVAFEQLSGYNQAEILGENCSILQGPLSDPKTRKQLKTALKEHNVFDGEILHYHKDGTAFWNQLTILPIMDDQNLLTNFMCISRDITEQKQINTNLLDAQQAAEHASVVKTQFLAMMSHEIRTPLNAILGMQELLTHTRLDNTQTEYLKTATLAGNNLLALINDILDLTKVESGKLDLEDIPFNAIEMTQFCVQLLSMPAEAKGLKLITDIDPELTPWISGDPLRFRQVVLNLLSNAIKFTEQGSVTIKLSSTSSTDSACVLLVEVIDTGIGIPKDLQTGLFEVFVQVDPSDTRKYGGSGLGLAISKRLVTLWGGQIGIDSTPSVGSRFWFTVGTLAEAPNQPIISTIKQDDSNIPNTCIARVLLVEDSLINQAVMTAMLRNGGHQVDLADCGAKGIEAASENVYDLILMDVSMPDMSGMEATAIIRQLGGAAAKVPIIAITAHALSGYQEMCLAAGMNSYATKPISQKDLLALVDTWCCVNLNSQTTAVLSPLLEISPALPVDEQETNIDKAILDELTATLGQAQVKELLQIYLTELNTRCETIKQAIISQDLSVLSREGHTIKSSSATFGATALQSVGKELEACGYNDDLATALLVVERLLPCAEATMKVMALHC